MPPRPFPQALSIGTDICHHPRFAKYFPVHQHLSSTTSAISSQTLLFHLFDKAFLPSEQRAFWRRFQDTPSSYRKCVPGENAEKQSRQWDEQKAIEAARYLGGRWAAKEAVIKAFTAEKRLLLRDVEIRAEGKGKAPYAVVLDAGSEQMPKNQSAKDVYKQLVKRWELREELKELRKSDGGNNGLRIVKKFSLNRHTAREQEMKKATPQPQQGIAVPENMQSTSSTITPESTSAAPNTSTAPILSKDSILDLSAITQILEQNQQTTSPTSTTSPQTPEPEQDQDTDTGNEQTREPQNAHQTRLEEEINRLRREEHQQQEDAWNNLQGQVVKVSISHDGEYCVATALAAV
ncbi:unnamed protein product [Aureobasidium uvarum]|uniref:4'-phosphopantetheinyl transferase domain-containing protein n=1 Tax=Aureobasidium uvarum TaxID=2773716 RepID=A0A9N8KCK8_9PEZI|nr:unnamed protein product [Aureobasidium uvarum]